MSKHLKPCCYEGKALELQFLNTVYGIHDLMCGCLQPIEHLKKIKQEQCPSTTDASTSTGDHDGTVAEGYDIDTGDLETLFATDTAEDAG